MRALPEPGGHAGHGLLPSCCGRYPRRHGHTILSRLAGFMTGSLRAYAEPGSHLNSALQPLWIYVEFWPDCDNAGAGARCKGAAVAVCPKEPEFQGCLLQLPQVKVQRSGGACLEQKIAQLAV